MMNGLKMWWNKPWTNGTYVKLSFWSILISMIVSWFTWKSIEWYCESENEDDE